MFLAQHTPYIARLAVYARRPCTLRDGNGPHLVLRPVQMSILRLMAKVVSNADPDVVRLSLRFWYKLSLSFGHLKQYVLPHKRGSCECEMWVMCVGWGARHS